jgi:hypothetical protein
MRLLAVLTVPVWQHDDGELEYGLEPNTEPPPVVDWANVLELELDGERYRLLLVAE